MRREKATGMTAVPLQPQVNPTEAAVRKLGRKCGWTKHTPPHPVVCPCQQKQVCLNRAGWVLHTVTGEHL